MKVKHQVNDPTRSLRFLLHGYPLLYGDMSCQSDSRK